MDESDSQWNSSQLPARDRRSDDRAATVFRPVLIEIGEFMGYCLVRNLSTGGMMGEVYVNLPNGTVIDAHFGTRPIRGRVTWSNDGRVGIQFDEDIDVRQVLADHTKSSGPHGNRAPRLPIRCAGELIIDDRAHPMEVQDISQRGVKALTHFVKEGDEVQVQVEGLEKRKAIVRWTRDGFAGLNFIRPIAFQELAHWAVDRQAQRWPCPRNGTPKLTSAQCHRAAERSA